MLRCIKQLNIIFEYRYDFFLVLMPTENCLIKNCKLTSKVTN